MSSNLNIIVPIITVAGTLLGIIVGGIFSYIIAKQNARMQYLQKHEEISRQAAHKRIELLYEPLVNIMASGASDDSFELSQKEDRGRIITTMRDNERYASSDLLNIFFGNLDMLNRSMTVRIKVWICI